MEKQRSFLVKSTRFLFLAFTITSSIIFLIFISTWVIKLTPPSHQETHFQVNKSSLALSSTIQALAGPNGKFSASQVKDSIFIGTHFGEAENASKSDQISNFDEGQVKKSSNRVVADEGTINKGSTLNSNFTSLAASQYLSVNGVDNSFPIAENPSKAENSTDVSENLAAEEPIIGDVNSSSTGRQQDLLISHASSVKTRTSSSRKSCDFTKGKWVFDESYPLYTNGTCPLIDEGFNCETNGRLDKDYMKWRWQPQDCDLPRINYYQEGEHVHPRLDVSVAFRRALVTWASWVDKHINPRKTQVFFRSSAPSHFSGGQWDTGGHCREAARPIDEISLPIYPKKNLIIEDVIRQMQTPVIYLNITTMSDYRIDGHPSIYGRMYGKSLSIQDCSHWCLPGVPDTWNQMMYSHLLFKERESRKPKKKRETLAE